MLLGGAGCARRETEDIPWLDIEEVEDFRLPRHVRSPGRPARPGATKAGGRSDQARPSRAGWAQPRARVW